MQSTMHVYEVRPRKDKRGVDLISDMLPFGRLWYGEPNAASNAIGCAKFYSRSHDAVIRVYDASGNVNETHEQAGEFKAKVSIHQMRRLRSRSLAGVIECPSRCNQRSTFTCSQRLRRCRHIFLAAQGLSGSSLSRSYK